MDETTATASTRLGDLARIREQVDGLEKMGLPDLVEHRDELLAIRSRLAYLELTMPPRPERVYTMRGDENHETEVTLEVKPGRAVFFDTGAGTISAYIAGGCLVVGSGETTGFPLAIRPESDGDVAIALDGWYPLELRAQVGA
jgi:hypothetical protein